MVRTINTYDDPREVVVQSKGLYKVTMGVLRTIEDAGRLGKIVRDRIHTNLSQHRLGHLPVELPNDQNDLIRIYDKDSYLNSLIEAVLHPSDAGDKTLRSLGGKDASKRPSNSSKANEERTWRAACGNPKGTLSY